MGAGDVDGVGHWRGLGKVGGGGVSAPRSVSASDHWGLEVLWAVPLEDIGNRYVIVSAVAAHAIYGLP